MSVSRNMKTVTVKLPDALDAALESLASSSGLSKSAVMRQLLESGLAHGSAGSRGSCADLARDLKGRIKGPRDLSFAPGHLEGYGR